MNKNPYKKMVKNETRLEALGNGILNEKVTHVKFINQNYSNSTVLQENISLEGKEISYNINAKKNSSKSTLDNIIIFNQ